MRDARYSRPSDARHRNCQSAPSAECVSDFAFRPHWEQNIAECRSISRYRGYSSISSAGFRALAWLAERFHRRPQDSDGSCTAGSGRKQPKDASPQRKVQTIPLAWCYFRRALRRVRMCHRANRHRFVWKQAPAVPRTAPVNAGRTWHWYGNPGGTTSRIRGRQQGVHR